MKAAPRVVDFTHADERIKVLKYHRCHKKHQSRRTLMSCMFPRAVWVSGSGEYAVLARCGVLTVTAWDSLEAAQEAKGRIDRTACGHRCHKAHELVRIVDPAQAQTWED